MHRKVEGGEAGGASAADAANEESEANAVDASSVAWTSPVDGSTDAAAPSDDAANMSEAAGFY